MNPNSQSIEINTEMDVITARQRGRELAAQLGFSLVDQSRITTAISELARNIVCYGVSGTVCILQVTNVSGRNGIECRFDDIGPGIQRLDQAMEQGFTSGGGLGAGLPGSKRLMDEFEIASVPGCGLHIVARKWR